MTATYVFDTGFAGEDERLVLGEQLWDPGTRVRLAALGVGPGWRCLEVGAGRGSVAGWMAARGASVTAVDLDTDRCRVPGVAVHRGDITREDPPGGDYDLVHARLVVQHLDRRRVAVRRMADALAPGGWLVLEDTDTASLFSHADGPFHPEVKAAAYAVMAESGYHPRCGLLDVDLAEDAGLTVHAEGRAEVVRGGTPAARWYALWLEHLRPRLLGRVPEAAVDAAVRDFADPAHTWLSQVMVTVLGRKELP
ncbi:methyltransferase [Actinokineospora spheciospongiae]|uniref:Methyltransferase n=1 Tax=Actinokineospora spheciospongiae TaxID=909613 RepID=W7IXK2_9PSEU|nr:methyltransferase domain-containing protein [Actinokineospora spheciospongiae]EWC61557.1 methyltransferase [Actinokineospora spheciospongiae]PWW51490.1 methyltransferase family protein [Actinokineospora spheciospongiae]